MNPWQRFRFGPIAIGVICLCSAVMAWLHLPGRNAGAELPPDGVLFYKHAPVLLDFSEQDHWRVAHEFTFRNPSSNPLVLTVAKKSCGCAAADITPVHVASGAECKVRLSFTPTYRRERRTESVTLATGNADFPALTMIVSAEIFPRIIVAPYHRHIEVGTKSATPAPVGFDVVVYNEPSTGGDLSLRADAGAKFAVAQEAPLRTSEHGIAKAVFPVQLSLAENLSLRPGQLLKGHVYWSAGEAATLASDVTIKRTAYIQVVPPSLFINALNTGDDVSDTVELSAATPFRIVGFGSTGEALTSTRLAPDEPSTSHKFMIRVNAAKPTAGKRAAKLMV